MDYEKKNGAVEDPAFFVVIDFCIHKQWKPFDQIWCFFLLGLLLFL